MTTSMTTTTSTSRHEPGVYPRMWCWTFLPKRFPKTFRKVVGNYRKYAKIPGFRAG